MYFQQNKNTFKTIDEKMLQIIFTKYINLSNINSTN